MTAKQKAAREKFKKVVAEAGKLRKKNPKLTQAQAVKQAWAISYIKAGKSKVGEVSKKYTKKQLEKIADDYAYITQGDVDKITYRLLDKDYTDKLLPIYLDKISEYNKKSKKVGAVKKKTDTKVKAKKGKTTEQHTDTKSHNVNIKVVSGFLGRLVIKTFTLSELKKMNPIYFEKGQDKAFGIYKRKLITSKKLNSQVMVEAKKEPFTNVRSYSVRLINAEGSIGMPKKFDTIFGAAEYIGKNIIL